MITGTHFVHISIEQLCMSAYLNHARRNFVSPATNKNHSDETNKKKGWIRLQHLQLEVTSVLPRNTPSRLQDKNANSASMASFATAELAEIDTMDDLSPPAPDLGEVVAMIVRTTKLVLAVSKLYVT